MHDASASWLVALQLAVHLVYCSHAFCGTTVWQPMACCCALGVDQPRHNLALLSKPARLLAAVHKQLSGLVFVPCELVKTFKGR
jgi:hypothetical protein